MADSAAELDASFVSVIVIDAVGSVMCCVIGPIVPRSRMRLLREIGAADFVAVGALAIVMSDAVAIVAIDLGAVVVVVVVDVIVLDGAVIVNVTIIYLCYYLHRRVFSDWC